MSSSPQAIREMSDDYGVDESLVSAHAIQAMTFATLIGVPLAAAASNGKLPESLSAKDLILLGIATHKLSRLLTRDKVTDFVRAPFTRHQEHAHVNEVNDKPRGRGLQRAMGELLSCPFCAGTWVAGTLVVGLVYAPRLTRVAEALFAAVSLSDLLHVLYAGAVDAVEE